MVESGGGKGESGGFGGCFYWSLSGGGGKGWICWWVCRG